MPQFRDEETSGLRASQAEAWETLRAHDPAATEVVERVVAEQREELVRRERLASLGQLVGSIAHELRNPLGVIESSAYLLRERPDDEARRTKHLGRITDQVRRANAIISDLLELLRDTPRANERVSLVVLAREAIDSLGTGSDLIRTEQLGVCPARRLVPCVDR